MDGIKKTLKKNKEYIAMVNKDLEVVQRELIKEAEKLYDKLTILINLK